MPKKFANNVNNIVGGTSTAIGNFLLNNAAGISSIPLSAPTNAQSNEPKPPTQ